MPSSSVANFTDAHAYEAAIRAAEAEILITESGEFRGELTDIDLPRLRIRRGHENLPRISHVRVPAGRALLYFLSGARQPAMHVGGKQFRAGEIMVCASNTTHHDWTAAPCGWGSISLTVTDLAAAEREVVGRDLDLASVTHLVRPDPVQGSRLMSLLEIVERLARTAPDIFSCHEVVRELEQELICAMIKCLSEGMPVEMGRGAHHHSEVIERFELLLAASRDRPLYLAEICTATGVSERTLRACCQEHFGMGPIQYLHLRRMHLARRALTLADPAASTVTEIATGFGFWELGRFSVEYRALFGESPSTSLRRPADRPERTRRFRAAAGNEAGNARLVDQVRKTETAWGH
jgi:AraC-like DNA-binding protein